MAYRNLNRPGLISSTSHDPRRIEEDLDERVRVLYPEATPLQSLKGIIGAGPAPKSHKIQSMQLHAASTIDNCSAVTLGTGNEARFARLTLDQWSRPDLQNIMYYYPQDKFFIEGTEQVVEVVMTQDAAIQVNGSDLTLTAAVTGATASRCLPGTVVVRNVEPTAIKTFTQSTVIFMGRTIKEGQDIEARSTFADVLYDANYLEHKEKRFTMTEDQTRLVKLKGTAPELDDNQNRILMDLKREVENTAFFSEREIDFTDPDGAKRHMRGLHFAIKTNVAHYDPLNVTDFETMFSNFLFEQAFRYNPNWKKEKLGICGGRFLFDFNMAFKDYRRTSSIQPQTGAVGMNIDTYVLPGGFKIALMRSDILAQNTNMEHWCYIIDPSQAEWRIALDYKSKTWQMPYERKINVAVEWQGSIAWHIEQSHALLRT